MFQMEKFWKYIWLLFFFKNVDELKNWNVSNGKYFDKIFGGCSKLSKNKMPQNLREKR